MMDVYTFERIMQRFDKVDAQIADLKTRIKYVTAQEKTEMARLDDLKLDMTAVTAKIEARKGIDDSMLELLATLAANQTALADQIASLQAGTVTDEEIQALQAVARDNAAAMGTESDRLVAAITANP
jgi:cell division protein FtsB